MIGPQRSKDSDWEQSNGVLLQLSRSEFAKRLTRIKRSPQLAFSLQSMFNWPTEFDHLKLPESTIFFVNDILLN